MSLTATRVVARPGTLNHRRVPDLRRWLSPLALLVLWQVASSTGLLPPDKLSSPWTVLQAGLETARSGELGDAFAVSITRVGIGFVIGAAVALLLGVVAGLSTWGGALIDPPVQMLRTLPFLGLIPLFILWFGIGEEPKILLVALGVLFPLYLNIFSGIRNIDRDLLEASVALGYTRRERLLHVVLPGAIPQTLVGLRQSLGMAWLALIVAETVNADAGLGYLINNARDFLRTDVIVVGLIVYALLGLITDGIVRLLEKEGVAMALSAKVRGLSKRFGERTVLSDVDIDLARGEFVALLGRSGSGKTTILRILAGLEPADSGQVEVSGTVSIAFQQPRLLPWRPVWRNVVLGLPGRGRDRPLAERALTEVRLAEHADAWPRTLSGGEAQRVSLARALVREPDLFLLDEPFGALDALTRLAMQALVEDLWREHGPGVLLVTHDVDEALLLADRVLVLGEGRIVAEHVLDHPRPRRLGDHLDIRAKVLADLGVTEHATA